jgi:hypothetical protein
MVLALLMSAASLRRVATPLTQELLIPVDISALSVRAEITILESVLMAHVEMLSAALI